MDVKSVFYSDVELLGHIAETAQQQQDALRIALDRLGSQNRVISTSRIDRNDKHGWLISYSDDGDDPGY